MLLHYCDSMDGPVVKTARKALKTGNVDLVLPYVPKADEEEVKSAFELVMSVPRRGGPMMNDLADKYFFETVVRLHMIGEGALYTGLKPTSCEVGPVIHVAEKAIDIDSVDRIHAVISRIIEEQMDSRFARVMELKKHADESVDAAREFVEQSLRFEVWVHKLYLTSKAELRQGDLSGREGTRRR